MNQEQLKQVAPYIQELGRSDARTDAQAGNQDRYTTYLALYTDGMLAVSTWQAYRTAYEAERAALLSSAQQVS